MHQQHNILKLPLEILSVAEKIRSNINVNGYLPDVAAMQRSCSGTVFNIIAIKKNVSHAHPPNA